MFLIRTLNKSRTIFFCFSNNHIKTRFTQITRILISYDQTMLLLYSIKLECVFMCFVISLVALWHNLSVHLFFFYFILWHIHTIISHSFCLHWFENIHIHSKRTYNQKRIEIVEYARDIVAISTCILMRPLSTLVFFFFKLGIEI